MPKNGMEEEAIPQFFEESALVAVGSGLSLAAARRAALTLRLAYQKVQAVSRPIAE